VVSGTGVIYQPVYTSSLIITTGTIIITITLIITTTIIITMFLGKRITITKVFIVT
jgi:hypothetical protein